MAKNKVKSVKSLRALAIVLSTGILFAQNIPVGSVTPKLTGQTLDGQPITLPNAAGGKTTLLLLGASKEAGSRTKAWKDRFLADFGTNPDVTYYVAALLEQAPAMFRGMIRGGMRSGTPPAERTHTLTCTSGEKEWKSYLGLADDKLPMVVLLDRNGHLQWSFNGNFEAGQYQSLKAAISSALERK